MCQLCGRCQLPCTTQAEAVACPTCGSPGREGGMLLCDGAGCKVAVHYDCLDPPLPAVPHGDWFCKACMLTVNKSSVEELHQCIGSHGCAVPACLLGPGVCNSHQCQLCNGYFHALCSPEELDRKTCGRAQCGGEDKTMVVGLLDRATCMLAVELVHGVQTSQAAAAAVAKSLGISPEAVHRLGCKAAKAAGYQEDRLLGWATGHTAANSAEPALSLLDPATGGRTSRSQVQGGLFRAMSLPKDSRKDQVYYQNT